MDPPRRTTLSYSLKNIPIPSNQSYLMRLVEKIESFVRRIRWRAHFFLNNGQEETEHATEEHYGLSSTLAAPHVKELEPFEEDLAKLIEDVEFRKVSNDFHSTLKKDINRIKASNSVFVKADKTRNMYELSKEQYDKLLVENVTKHYRTAANDAADTINAEAEGIARKLRIADRINITAERDAYITLKDHKETFPNSLPCRLINPTKSEIGLVSKHILDRINQQLIEHLKVTMWRNSADVIQWFQDIEEKNDCTFICFDIAEFYPSISKRLLNDALEFAQQYVEISDEETEVINHARKSLLFNGGRPWMKKDGLFDVTMGSFDGAEICELVGLFALAKLPAQFRNGNTGLYRDDGLAVFKGMSGPKAERTKKDLQSYFQKLGLRITIQSNLKIVNFLDVSLNLANGKYYPFRKPGDNPIYINRQSNHPPSILKQLPGAISRRLTDLSCSETAFEDAAPMYNAALKASGYAENVMYDQTRKVPHAHTRLERKRSRRRKVTWFNPPFSRHVKTNIGRKFLILVKKHFPKDHKLHKIFNPSTIKISYSCMPCVDDIVKQHNSYVRRQEKDDENARTCNCRTPGDCPLRGECLASEIVYCANVTVPSSTTAPKQYIGSTATSFKQRFANHKSSFTHRNNAQTELSKYIWHLKNKQTDFEIRWEILQRAKAYSNKSKRCNLCLAEKVLIARASKSHLLNKRSEFMSKCRHRRKFQLSNFTH